MVDALKNYALFILTLISLTIPRDQTKAYDYTSSTSADGVNVSISVLNSVYKNSDEIAVWSEVSAIGDAEATDDWVGFELAVDMDWSEIGGIVPGAQGADGIFGIRDVKLLYENGEEYVPPISRLGLSREMDMDHCTGTYYYGYYVPLASLDDIKRVSHVEIPMVFNSGFSSGPVELDARFAVSVQ